jgi:hypothetical protein
MTDRELNALKIIQMNLNDDFDSLTRNVLIFKLTVTKATIDRLIAAAEETSEPST